MLMDPNRREKHENRRFWNVFLTTSPYVNGFKQASKLWMSAKRWKMLKKVKNGEKWWKMVKSGEKWWKMVKNGEMERWKMVKSCEKLWKTKDYPIKKKKMLKWKGGNRSKTKNRRENCGKRCKIFEMERWKMWKMLKICEKCWKIVKIGEREWWSFLDFPEKRWSLWTLFIFAETERWK